MRVIAKVESPPDISTDFHVRLNGPDKGLLNAYVCGLQIARRQPELAKRAVRGELPALLYKGGTDQPLKIKQKYGPLLYLAMWHGLRGDDLDMDTDREYTIKCAATGLLGIYTPDVRKYAAEGG